MFYTFIKLRLFLPLLCVLPIICLSSVFVAEAYVHGEESHRPEGLFFSHPLIAESPSPDTKVRFDYFYLDIDGNEEKAKKNTINFEAEYAFHRSFSIELGVPYTFHNPEDESSSSHVGKIEINFKFANFAFEKTNLLVGYGIEFGLPTGDEEKGIGSDHIFEIEPYLSFGYKRRLIEIVAFTLFGIPTNQNEGEEVETELGYNISFLYKFLPHVKGIIEFDGETVLSGEEEGKTIVNITPGILLSPLRNDNLHVGLGVSFPVTDKEEFDFRTIVSIFYHFM